MNMLMNHDLKNDKPLFASVAAPTQAETRRLVALDTDGEDAEGELLTMVTAVGHGQEEWLIGIFLIG